MGNKYSAYPPEYAKQLRIFNLVRYWTLETASHMEKIAVGQPRMERPETDRNRLLPPVQQPFANAHKVFDNFSGHFAGTHYGHQMDQFSFLFEKLSKHSIHSQKRAFEDIIMPMKVWATEMYPALLKDLKKCKKLKKNLDRLLQASSKKPKDQGLQKRAQAAKQAYERFAAECNLAMSNMNKFHFYQTQLWRMYQEIQVTHCLYVSAKVINTLDAVMEAA